MTRSPPSSRSFDVTFRPARRDDLAAILALLADDPFARARMPERAEDFEEAFAAIEASAANELWVGEREGAVVACAQLTLIPGLGRGGAWRALIEAVRVRADLRGRGVGEALMRFVTARAKARGASLAQLTSDARRVEARRFYERLGFAASHVGFKKALD